MESSKHRGDGLRETGEHARQFTRTSVWQGIRQPVLLLAALALGFIVLAIIALALSGAPPAPTPTATPTPTPNLAYTQTALAFRLHATQTALVPTSATAAPTRATDVRSATTGAVLTGTPNMTATLLRLRYSLTQTAAAPTASP